MKLALLHLADARPHDEEFQTMLDELNASTRDAALANGWRVELVPSGELPIEATLDAVDGADAVIVMGGEDVSPELYGGAKQYPGMGHLDRAADEAHLAAIRAAIDRGTPLLGICRGLQLINVALGGTLIQHLEGSRSHSGSGRGWDLFAPHEIEVDEGSDLCTDVPREAVYCGHHQAIDRLGDELRVVARARDGGIEAVAHTSAPVTGVQWHPEFTATAASQVPPLLDRLRRQVLHDRVQGREAPAPHSASGESPFMISA